MSEVATVLFPGSVIRRRVQELGRELTRDYEGRSPVFISVLKGGAVFLADLFREVPLPVRVDFMSVSSYGGASESSGVVRIVKDLDQDVGGEDVVVVEDIIDTGLTLSYLLSALRERAPRSIEVCTLLDRSARRIPRLDLRYVGFDCPDRFVVGYGLDFQERYRNLSDILAVDDMAALGADPDLLVPYLDAEPPRMAGVGG
ncbi:MAG: hypoxanthine phosphoribosyltransferase [Actinomycetota bacterium]|nr:hypoxanthine phosphoribosyltransferase [Actinomycetota bacterium]